MPHCDCGFDFAKAHIKGRRLVSYALIPQKSYRAAIRREHAIIGEKNSDRKSILIAEASSFVGSLTRCPACGAWLLDEPGRKGGVGYSVLHGSEAAANKRIHRTRRSPIGHGGPNKELLPVHRYITQKWTLSRSGNLPYRSKGLCRIKGLTNRGIVRMVPFVAKHLLHFTGQNKFLRGCKRNSK